MSGRELRRLTGVCGIGYLAIQLVGVVLFVAAGNAPSFDDAKRLAEYISTNSGLFVGDAFATVIAVAVFLVFLTGLRSVIRTLGEDWEWAAALVFGTGLVGAAVLIAGAALEAATALVSTSGADPGSVRTAWAATGLIFTFIYLPGVIFGGTVWYVVSRTKLLPAWVGWLSAISAILDLAAVLTVFGGTGTYGPLGLLPLILGGMPTLVWFLGVSVVLLTATPATAPRGAGLTRAG